MASGRRRIDDRQRPCSCERPAVVPAFLFVIALVFGEFDARVGEQPGLVAGRGIAPHPVCVLAGRETEPRHMLKGFLIPSVLAALTASAALPAGAGEAPRLEALRPGAYEIEFRLELPHLKEIADRRRAAMCLTAPQAAATQGLGVVSDNNPLSACMPTNVERSAGILAFDIVCPGTNAARGRADYRLGADWFEGRIAMKMGGKNMTMTEVQSGRRSGDCDSASVPAPLPSPGAAATPQMQHQN